MRQLFIHLLASMSALVTASADETNLRPLAESPNSRYGIAIRYPMESPPTEFERGKTTDTRMEEGSTLVATANDGSVIQSFSGPRGFLWATWKDSSDYFAIRWHVYRTDGGCELYRVDRTESKTTFEEMKLPDEPFLRVMALDTEFSSDLKWLIRPFEWRGKILRVECIPLSKGDEPHPYAQDRVWYEVDTLITKRGKFRPVALHATHGNHRGDGTLIRQNPVWRIPQAEGDAVQPATAVDSKSEGNEKTKPKSKGRSQ